jgi:hypothetical protein
MRDCGAAEEEEEEEEEEDGLNSILMLHNHRFR